MPVRIENGQLKLIRIPPYKSYYFTLKEDDGRTYLYSRKIDSKSLERFISAENAYQMDYFFSQALGVHNDWLIPIKRMWNIDPLKVQKHCHTPEAKTFAVLSKGERPDLYWIESTGGIVYICKKRESYSTALQSLSLAATFQTAMPLFAAKQVVKERLSTLRGERNPSLVPKMFVYKVWQVPAGLKAKAIYRYLDDLFGRGYIKRSFSSYL
jgi:hypothetical protein